MTRPATESETKAAITCQVLRKTELRDLGSNPSRADHNKKGNMKEPENITGIPAIAKGFIDGMREAIRNKWYEAATGCFLRAVTNYQTAEACKEAGFTDAAVHFANRSVYYLAQGCYCLAQVEASKCRLK